MHDRRTARSTGPLAAHWQSSPRSPARLCQRCNRASNCSIRPTRPSAISRPSSWKRRSDSVPTRSDRCAHAREIHLLGGMIDAPSYNIPRGWLEFRVADTVPTRHTDRRVLRHQPAQSAGGRDPDADGLHRVGNYADGFFTWRDSGLPVEAPDLALDSMLFRKPQQVADGVWSAIGATEPAELRTPATTTICRLSSPTTVCWWSTPATTTCWRAPCTRDQEDHRPTGEIRGPGERPGSRRDGFGVLEGTGCDDHRPCRYPDRAEGAWRGDPQRVLRRSRATKGMGTRLVLPDQTFEDKLVIEMGNRHRAAATSGRRTAPATFRYGCRSRKSLSLATSPFTSACCRCSNTPIPLPGSRPGTVRCARCRDRGARSRGAYRHGRGDPVYP